MVVRNRNTGESRLQELQISAQVVPTDLASWNHKTGGSRDIGNAAGRG